MKLDRTLSATWALTGADVPALAAVSSRARTVVVDDVETLCASIVVDVSRSDAPYVPTETSDLYEALGFLLGRVIEVLPKYDPTKGRQVHDPWTAGFKMWLHAELTCDVIDQWRSWNGRNGHKRIRPTSSTLLREDADDDEDPVDRVERAARRGRPPGEAAGDRGDSGLDALRRRFLEGGDRALLREVETLGLGSARRARGRAARADRAAALEQLDELVRVA